DFGAVGDGTHGALLDGTVPPLWRRAAVSALICLKPSPARAGAMRSPAGAVHAAGALRYPRARPHEDPPCPAPPPSPAPPNISTAAVSRPSWPAAWPFAPKART